MNKLIPHSEFRALRNIAMGGYESLPEAERDEVAEHIDRIIAGLEEQYESALRHFDYIGGLMNAALDYRSCGRFDITPCRERPEMMPSDWCAWCALMDAVSSPTTDEQGRWPPTFSHQEPWQRPFMNSEGSA